MRKVLFITPNITGAPEDESVGTLLLTSILRQNNISTDILQFADIGDPNNLEAFICKFVQLVLEEQPVIVSFYCRCDTYHIVLTMAERLKIACNDIYIVFGGPQADITSYDTINEMAYVDFVCCGEGELTIVPFFSSLLEGSPDLTVDGLVYRNGEKVCVNPRPSFVHNLDDLPSVDYSLLHFSSEKQPGHIRWFPIDVGRGCPFSCTYCSTKTFWGRKYRLKSPQRIVQEIKDIYEQFGITSFAFLHDMFTMNRKQITEVCELLKGIGFPIIWRCSARIDCIDEKLIDIMYDAGLRILYVGIETGSARMQKLINKNLKLDNVIDLMSYIHNKGIHLRTSFIYGFPDETEEDISETIALIGQTLKIKDTLVQTHLCTFLPGTELSSRLIAEMTTAETYSDITGTIAVEECRGLIDSHPKLFQHFLEYKTELRTKLRFFSSFIALWRVMQPVYQYISEKYGEHRLMDMYYDFVKSNDQVLKKIDKLSLEDQVEVLRKQDRFISTFEKDKNFDILKDAVRLINTVHALRKGEINSSQDVYVFSPVDLDRQLPIQEYSRCIAMVIYERNLRGQLTRKILINGQ